MMKTAEDYAAIIQWKKSEFHNNGWNALDLKAADIMKKEDPVLDEVDSVTKGMLWNMREGDTVLKGDVQHPDQSLTIRYYCDNLDETRKSVFNH
jgi:hypothetical protein